MAGSVLSSDRLLTEVKLLLSELPLLPFCGDATSGDEGCDEENGGLQAMISGRSALDEGVLEMGDTVRERKERERPAEGLSGEDVARGRSEERQRSSDDVVC